ncbi:ATP-binding cassette domain-containing protein [Microbacterium sp. cx-59]|uniref:ATP-binding cassette domain-containing protein n=1 Tax=Microbacterium sp. cx-59 TaxID=2891207 RepID=UPI001E4D834B|nr:ATP-binding cassette domain-containing protein [Microbacterium sp. cx-59]MCC4908541.1 ATP-binding cassette domain-containing protein [Microbacterium sp. cx-59]
MLLVDDLLCAARLDGVTVTIGDARVLHPLDLRVRRGVLTVISGPNGAGKTTLLETLAGVRRPTAGTVDRAGVAAFVPQRTAIPDTLPLTVGEVAAMGTWGRRGRAAPRALSRSARRTAIERALDALDLAALRRTPFAALSGGQRQRALIAQALARRADLLLLDEPTTGLDDESAIRIERAMDAELARGATVVCVSHDAALRARAHDTVRIEDGRIVRAAS